MSTRELEASEVSGRGSQSASGIGSEGLTGCEGMTYMTRTSKSGRRKLTAGEKVLAKTILRAAKQGRLEGLLEGKENASSASPVVLNFDEILSKLDDEKRRPLAVMFYNRESNSLQFHRAKGVELHEFISIVRQYLYPYYAMSEEEAAALRLERAKAVLREQEAR